MGQVSSEAESRWKWLWHMILCDGTSIVNITTDSHCLRVHADRTAKPRVATKYRVGNEKVVRVPDWRNGGRYVQGLCNEFMAAAEEINFRFLNLFLFLLNKSTSQVMNHRTVSCRL